MPPVDVEPSLCSGEPALDRLDDGFSPPAAIAMNATTHHQPPLPESDENEDEATPNTSQQPVEPEFGQALPPAEPEDPGVKPPHL